MVSRPKIGDSSPYRITQTHKSLPTQGSRQSIRRIDRDKTLSLLGKLARKPVKQSMIPPGKGEIMREALERDALTREV